MSESGGLLAVFSTDIIRRQDGTFVQHIEYAMPAKTPIEAYNKYLSGINNGLQKQFPSTYDDYVAKTIMFNTFPIGADIFDALYNDYNAKIKQLNGDN